MKRTAQILTLLAVSLASMLLAFFVCANFNINPFGGIHGTGSSDTVYVPKTITISVPSVTSPVLFGKPLSDSQRVSLNRSRSNSRSGGLDTYDVKSDTVRSDSAKSYNEPFPIDSICPPFWINDSLQWKLSQRIVLKDSSYDAIDSGFYKISFGVDPSFKRIFDLSLSCTPLHPVVIEKQITNTITVRKTLRLGLFTEYDLLSKGFVVGLRGTVNLGAINFYGAPYYDGNNLHAPLGAEGLIFEH